jgi:signal transduction histidine kinase
MTGAVILLSFGFLYLTRSLIKKDQNFELKNAETEIFRKLETLSNDSNIIPKFGGTLGDIPKLPYYITYMIYDADDYTVLATNDPFLPFLEDSAGSVKRLFIKDFFFDGDLNIIYYAKAHSDPKKHNIVIVTARNMDNNSMLIMYQTLPLALLLMSLPILFLSFLTSLFITRRTIKPVKRITKAAQSVSVENLSDLLPLRGYDDEIDELSQTFNELFLRLKRDFDRERQFSSDVSHELNTPLTVISGQTGLLLRWGKNNPEQLEKSLNAIKTEAKTMHAIIANLLQISRIESGRIKPQISKVEIKPLFSWLVEEFAAVAPNMKINTVCDDIVLRTDSEMLHQILTVLISNSLKYAGVNCTVTLKAEKKGKKIILEQSDDGPGFSEEALPHIFERFYRADEAHSRKISGSGQGLAIAQTLCNALEAKITARNMVPHGAGFVVEF